MFAHREIVFQKLPVSGVGIAECPIADTSEAIFPDGIKFRLGAACVLEPDLMSASLFIRVFIERGLRRFVILDRGTVFDRPESGFGHAEGLGLLPLDERQEPVPGIYLETQENLFSRYDGDGVIKYAPDLI